MSAVSPLRKVKGGHKSIAAAAGDGTRTSHIHLDVAALQLPAVQQVNNALLHGLVEVVPAPAPLEAGVHLGPRPELAPLGQVQRWVGLPKNSDLVSSGEVLIVWEPSERAL